MQDNSKEIFQAIVETAIDGIMTIDTKGAVLSINEAACKLFQYTEEEVVGKNISLLMPEPDHSKHDRYISNYLHTGTPKIIGIGRDVMARRKDGVIFPARLAVSDVKLLDGSRIFTGIIHDLTEVRKAEKEIKELNRSLEDKVRMRTNELQKAINELLSLNKKLKHQEEQLRESLDKEKELNVLKSRFVAMASHEFRTPLTTIQSSASLVAKYEREDQQDRRQFHVERIRKSVSYLNSILDDFLSISVLEEGKIKLTKTEADPFHLCEQVKEELKGFLKENQQLNLTRKGVSRKVVVDENIFRNIIFNLTTNAIKYSEEDVEIVLEYAEEGIRITVKDRGIGIPEEDKKYLFSRFFRASNAVNIKGTGLGLSIVKTYLDLIGGEISFKSEADIGSEFYVCLPSD